MNTPYFTGRIFNHLGDQTDIIGSHLTGGIGVKIQTPSGEIMLDVYHSETTDTDVVEVCLAPKGAPARRTTHSLTIPTGGKAPSLDKLKARAAAAF